MDINLDAEQKRILNQIFQQNLKPMENLLFQLLQSYEKTSLGSPDYNPDAVVKEFASFIEAKRLGNSGVDEELRVAYREFAQQKQIPEEELDITKANPSLLLLMRGMEYFVKQAEERIHEKYRQFLQQLSMIFMGLETAARPAVEIFQMQVASGKEDMDDAYQFPLYARFDANTNQKYNEGHLGEVPFFLHTRLKAKLLDETESHDKNTRLLLELTYNGDRLPETFPPISAFFYGDDMDLRYRFLWLLKTSKTQSIQLRFPVHNFAYPPDIVNIPYRYAWRYHDPYPAVLDFLFEIAGCKKKDFREESSNLWKANYKIELKEKLLKPKKGDWNDFFFVNAFPVFYWHVGDNFVASNKIRLCEDATRTIWIRAGKEDQQLPVPLYYVDNSGEGTGWVSQHDQELFLHVLPQRREKKTTKSQIGVHALFAGYPLKKDEKFLLSTDLLTSSQRAAIQVKRLVSCENMGVIQFQPRMVWLEKQNHKQFWEMLNQSCRQGQDDGYILAKVKEYLVDQLRPYNFSPEWLSVTGKKRSLALVDGRLIPCCQVLLQLDLEQIEKAEKSVSLMVGVLWKAMDRFYVYLLERLPPNLSLHVTLYDFKHQTRLLAWSEHSKNEQDR